jgi:hypothetical protein
LEGFIQAVYLFLQFINLLVQAVMCPDSGVFTFFRADRGSEDSPAILAFDYNRPAYPVMPDREIVFPVAVPGPERAAFFPDRHAWYPSHDGYLTGQKQRASRDRHTRHRAGGTSQRTAGNVIR